MKKDNLQGNLCPNCIYVKFSNAKTPEMETKSVVAGETKVILEGVMKKRKHGDGAVL